MSRRIGRVFAVALALSLVGVACGDDDDETQSSETEATGAPSPDSTAAATEPTDAAAPSTEPPESSEAAAPTGDPIVMSVIGQSAGPAAQPDVYSGAEAAAGAINAAGGIVLPDGTASPIEILTCDGAFSVDPNSPLNCAREAVEAGAIVSVAKYSSGDDIYTEFEKAGIPVVGLIALSPGDFTNPLSYPLHPGSVGVAAGLGALAQSQGAKTVALITNDLPSGRAVPPFITPFLEDPADLVAEIYLPLDPSADISSLIAQATDADAVLSVNSAGGTIRVINALNQAGYTGLIAVPGVSASQDLIEQIGDAADRVVIAGGWDAISSSDSELAAEFLVDMAEYSPDSVLSEFAFNAWLAVHYTADALAESGADSAALIGVLEGREVDFDVAPAFSLTDGTNPLGLNRIFRMTIQPQKVEDGQVVAIDGEFIDLSAL